MNHSTLNFRTTTGTLFTIEADVFISAMGGLSTPLDKPPGMKGIENFAGEVFHSARWNHELPCKSLAPLFQRCGEWSH
jgi:cation diffusion facilitator CzcD-associated flavoprotein CzcO